MLNISVGHLLAATAVITIVLALLATQIIKAIHGLNRKIENPDLRKLVVGAEDTVISQLSEHAASIRQTANTAGLPLQFAAKLILELLKAEEKDPFSRDLDAPFAQHIAVITAPAVPFPTPTGERGPAPDLTIPPPIGISTVPSMPPFPTAAAPPFSPPPGP